MAPWVEALRRRGLEADAVDLPRRKAEDAVPVWRSSVPDGSEHVAGGHSFGGRVASLAAADPDVHYGALVLLSYPLHRPGGPDSWDARTEHWPRIDCPVLLLSGEADPFARVELLRRAASRLREAELVTWPRIGHGLLPVRDEAIDRIVAFLDERTPD
jgi:predicted alpha/beta-hydrolase family hydrolase